MARCLGGGFGGLGDLRYWKVICSTENQRMFAENQWFWKLEDGIFSYCGVMKIPTRNKPG